MDRYIVVSNSSAGGPWRVIDTQVQGATFAQTLCTTDIQQFADRIASALNAEVT